MMHLFSVKIVIPKKWIAGALVEVKAYGYETLEDFFQTLTGVIVEQKGHSAKEELKYNGISEQNGAYVYTLNMTGSYEKLLKILSNQFLLNMLRGISPYSAHHTIAVNAVDNLKKRNVYYINIGHDDGFSYNLPMAIPSSSSSNENVTAAPATPKKQKKASNENTLESVPMSAIEDYDSYITIKLIVPKRNIPAAMDAVKGVGFSSLANFFDALDKMIKVENKKVEYNEVSRQNGAYVFIMEVSADYDNMPYVFDKTIMEYMRTISPHVASSVMHLYTPVKTGAKITYEADPQHYISVGEKSEFVYYLGETHEELMKDECAGVWTPLDVSVITDDEINDAILQNESALDENLLKVKTENQNYTTIVGDRVHARIIELQEKLEDLVLLREYSQTEIEKVTVLLEEYKNVV